MSQQSYFWVYMQRKMRYWRVIFNSMFIDGLFIIAKHGHQSAHQWANEYRCGKYRHNRIFFSYQKKTTCHLWQHGGHYAKCYESPAEKDKYRMISLICGIWKKSHRSKQESKIVVTRVWGQDTGTNLQGIINKPYRSNAQYGKYGQQIRTIKLPIINKHNYSKH